MFVIHENTGAIMTIIVMMIRILMATLYARASKRTRERERRREREREGNGQKRRLKVFNIYNLYKYMCGAR